MASLAAEQFEDSSRNLDSVTMNSENDVEDQGSTNQSFLIAGVPHEMYECEKCEVKKPTYKQLFYHMKLHHRDINLYECERCGKEFCYFSGYRNHACVNILEKSFVCKICKKGFKLLTNLRQHELTHKTEKTHRCPYCDKIFYHTKGLHKHLTYHKEKHILFIPIEQSLAIAGSTLVKYECEKCEVKKPTYKQLLHHMRQHKDIHLYECERCGKEFKQRSRYLTHTRVYQLDKTFICKICSKRFKTITHLRQHELTHKTEKTHPCPNCDKIYCHMKGLKSHLMSHKEKHLLCIKCNKKFQYNSQLKIHMALVHSLGVIKGNDDTTKVVKLQKQFTCEICGKLFVSVISLKTHIKHKHNQIHNPKNINHYGNRKKLFPCSYCSKTLSTSVALTCHMQYHINSKNTSMDPKTIESLLKYKCNECDKAFTNLQFLKNHKVIHSGLKEHICSHCGKGFAFKWYLERHVRLVHDLTHPKNIVCSICRKVAANTHALKSHMLSHTGESPFHCKFCDSKFRYEKSLRIHMRNKHESKNE